MILFVGVAGAGKSVQGKYLSDLLGFPWVSTGELLRQHISGEKRERMLRGELLTDEELYEIVEPLLLELVKKTQIILDGFPRTINQAEWLQHFLERVGSSISCVIQIEADKEVVMSRLMKRGRPDDTKEGISRRFDEYQRATLPILTYFDQLEIPRIIIDGNGTEDEVRDAITDEVRKLGIKKAL